MSAADVDSRAAIPILLVATTTSWLGTARIPKTLAEAGFHVSLRTPRGSLAEASRYVAKVDYLPDQATPMQWLEAFAAGGNHLASAACDPI